MHYAYILLHMYAIFFFFFFFQAEDGIRDWSVTGVQTCALPIFTDINMPMMDGLKLVTLIRGNARTKTLPIVIVTTEGAEEDRKRGLALGANAYVPKPIQPSALLKTLASLLQPPRS